MNIKMLSDHVSDTEPLWARRPRLGPYPYYDDPNELWLDCVSYFEWVEANPVKTIDVMKYQGEMSLLHVPRPRPMTQLGLCVFLAIDPTTWREWRKRDEPFNHVVATVNAIIYEQKFAGACVGLFNPALIARELGLMSPEPEQPLLFAPEDLPTITADMGASEAAEIYARTLEGSFETPLRGSSG